MLYVKNGLAPALTGLALAGTAVVAAFAAVPDDACDYSTDPNGAAVGLPTAISVAGWLAFGLAVAAAGLSVRLGGSGSRTAVFACVVLTIVLELLLLAVDVLAYSCWH
jgi:hypothetical protein